MSYGFTDAKRKLDEFTAILEDLERLVGERRAPERLNSGDQVAPGLGLTADAALIRERIHDTRTGSFRILVMGEFKNGKSTLLNAMLGEELLPSKVVPATAVITLVTYGTNRHARIYERKAEDLIVNEMGLDEFRRVFQITAEDQENLKHKNSFDRFANYEYVELESDYPLIGNGVVVIDSPGLGERASRTKVVRNYLTKVQALVIVLRADKILSDKEREFIDSLGSRRLEHVFFVVNRINTVPEEERDEIRDFVRMGLSPYFLTDDEEFDEELYNRRVFFVDAKGALDARLKKVEPSKQVLDDSQVPAFEAELERFLTPSEKLRAAFTMTLTTVAQAIRRAIRETENQSQALDQSLEDLLQRQAEADQEFEGLETRRRELESRVMRYGSVAARKVYTSLNQLIDSLPATWKADADKYMDLDKVLNVVELTKSVFSEKAKERISKAINDELDKYLTAKFEAWSLQADKEIGTVVQTLSEDIKADVIAFELKLNDIAGRFASADNRGLLETEKGAARVAKIGLLAGYWLFVPGGYHDVGMLTGMMFNKFSWQSFITRLAQQVGVIVVTVVIATFFGPVAWAALFVLQGGRVVLERNQLKNRLKQSIGETLHKSLKEQVQTLGEEVQTQVEGRFKVIADDITSALKAEIERIRAEQQRIIDLKRSTESAVVGERERLKAVRQLLTTRADAAALVAIGRHMSADDLSTIA